MIRPRMIGVAVAALVAAVVWGRSAQHLQRVWHRIEDDLSETWLEDWAGAGVAEIEAYLTKHADFLRFLDSYETA